MEQVEDARTVLGVALVESLDPGPRQTDQLVVSRLGALGSIAKIGEQGKEEIGIAVSEITDLEGLQ